mmetsp:Transcript_103097/g.222602  ORF Transcript_103097/g.222602 Transcript_103097/m.222602 type:complete len:126 (-) Transcript_103097:720-1097(-)
MIILPVDLMFRSQSLPQMRNQIDVDLASIREHQRQIHSKALNGKASKDERKQMKRLKQEERLLLDRSDMLNISGHNLVEQLVVFIKPFKIATGVVFGGISVCFMMSNLVNVLDRLLHSQCGFKCG